MPEPERQEITGDNFSEVLRTELCKLRYACVSERWKKVLFPSNALVALLGQHHPFREDDWRRDYRQFMAELLEATFEMEPPIQTLEGIACLCRAVISVMLEIELTPDPVYVNPPKISSPASAQGIGNCIDLSSPDAREEIIQNAKWEAYQPARLVKLLWLAAMDLPGGQKLKLPDPLPESISGALKYIHKLKEWSLYGELPMFEPGNPVVAIRSYPLGGMAMELCYLKKKHGILVTSASGHSGVEWIDSRTKRESPAPTVTLFIFDSEEDQERHFDLIPYKSEHVYAVCISPSGEIENENT